MKRCDGQTDRQTDGQTDRERSVLRAAWSQLKIDGKNICMEHIVDNVFVIGGQKAKLSRVSLIRPHTWYDTQGRCEISTLSAVHHKTAVRQWGQGILLLNLITRICRHAMWYFHSLSTPYEKHVPCIEYTISLLLRGCLWLKFSSWHHICN